MINLAEKFSWTKERASVTVSLCIRPTLSNVLEDSRCQTGGQKTQVYIALVNDGGVDRQHTTPANGVLRCADTHRRLNTATTVRRPFAPFAATCGTLTNATIERSRTGVQAPDEVINKAAARHPDVIFESIVQLCSLALPSLVSLVALRLSTNLTL